MRQSRLIPFFFKCPPYEDRLSHQSIHHAHLDNQHHHGLHPYLACSKQQVDSIFHQSIALRICGVSDGQHQVRNQRFATHHSPGNVQDGHRHQYNKEHRAHTYHSQCASQFFRPPAHQLQQIRRCRHFTPAERRIHPSATLHQSKYRF